MKIVNYVLTLLATSSVFANSYESFILEAACNEMIHPYSNCFKIFFDENSIASACEISKKDDCYGFFLSPKEKKSFQIYAIKLKKKEV